MKNIHVLPTDKSSNIVISSFDNKLKLNNNTNDSVEYNGRNQHIYITSDEEIKEGDWVITPTNDIIQWAKVFQPIGKKIILTTDQYLIRNSVQAINEEFLEWFIKNPKSENVYVYKKYKQVNQNNPVTRGSTALGFSHYEVQSLDVSAPIGTNEKEVVSNLPNGDDFFKQETLGYICPTTKKQCDDECCVSAEDCHIEASFDIISDCEEPKQEIKQTAVECLEQEIFRRYKFTFQQLNCGPLEEAIQQAKEMENQQRGYSEEEVLEFTQTIIQQYKLGNTNIEQLDLLKETLELFKKNKI